MNPIDRLMRANRASTRSRTSYFYEPHRRFLYREYIELFYPDKTFWFFHALPNNPSSATSGRQHHAAGILRTISVLMNRTLQSTI